MEVTDASVATRHLARTEPDSEGSGHVHEDPAERAFRVLTSSAYRKGSLARSQLERHRSVMLQVLRRRVGQGKPIQLTLMAFPFKVPNPMKVGARTLPDMAEYAALLRFGRLRSAIGSTYSPALKVDLILDGRALAPVVGVSRSEVDAYQDYLRKLVVAAGVADCVTLHDFDDLLADGGLPMARELPRLRRAAEAWWARERGSAEWQTCFRRTLGMINVRDLPHHDLARAMSAASTGRLPDDLCDLEARVGLAMIEYRLFDLVVHELDPRPRHFPDAIHVTTQERPGRLALWLVRRGRSHLPWHGVGVVDAWGGAHVMPLADVLASGGYEAVSITGESSPFFYRSTAPETSAGS